MTDLKKIGFYTLGCKLNFAETDAIAQSFDHTKFIISDFSEKCDYYVVNSCCVTEQAHKKTKYQINKLHHLNQESKIIVIGCSAQINKEELEQLPGVSIVLDAAQKFEVHRYIESIESGIMTEFDSVSECDIQSISIFNPSISSEGRTRSFLKVQDGCDYTCSYCTIPLARGKSRNATIAELVNQANTIAKLGYKELVFTGVNVGDFGKTTGERFIDLLQSFEEEVNIPRIRLSSVEPNLLTDDIIQFIGQSKKIMPFFHIPLQSGSDDVLKLMRRRYNTEMFRSKIEKIISILPNAGIGVDIIAGMPGEIDHFFEKSIQFVELLPISFLHVFSYSSRKNTDALNISPKVPLRVIQERSKRLHELSDKKQSLFLAKNNGTFAEVLFEESSKKEKLHGFTEHYIRVEIPYNENYVNTIVKVQLLSEINDTKTMQATVLPH